MIEIIKSLGKSVYWIILVLLFGLSKLWIDMAQYHYGRDIVFEIYPFIKDNGLMLFSLSVTIGIAIDFQLDKNLIANNLFEKTIFSIIPYIFIFLITSSYLIIFSFGELDEGDKIEHITFLNLSSVIFTIGYAMLTKTYMFNKN